MRSHRPPLHLVEARPGDGPLDEPKLLTAAQVAAYLRMLPKKVYDLPIPKVYLSERRVRWLERDVLAFVQDHRAVP